MAIPHDQLESIFDSALQIHSDSDRQRYLTEACGSNDELRARVDELLEHHRCAGRFLTDLNKEHDSANKFRHEQVGDSIGSFELVEKLGEGGFGLVFRAKQQSPIRREVAIKLMKPGMDSAPIVARFELERQSLAVMDHTNIARVMDGGQSASGLPYFVMELIHGAPITNYCDEHRLTLRQRLELFLPVCQAVQHAHQKGVIHRDLKPSNVLVTEIDNRPIPKVIDFGVAKAIGLDKVDTMNTHVGSIVGTLEYMSPEQASPGPDGIDTRCDVYGLGVILYELLTSTTPLQCKNLKRTALEEMLRMIRDEEPPKPSSRLSSIDELPTVAAKRGVEPRALNHVIQGDLDWIVMKSLEKDRQLRYPTANDLARDLERYLSGEPVEAGPRSTTYRFRKFLTRNRVPVLVGSLFLLCLIGGIVGTSIGLVQANRALKAAQQQRDRAERHQQRAMSVVDRLLTRVGTAGLSAVPHMDQTRRRILQDALEVYQEILHDESENPTVRREVGRAWQRVGAIQNRLGQNVASTESLQHAIAIQESLLAEHPSNLDYENDYVQSHRHLAQNLVALGRFPDAERNVTIALDRVANKSIDSRHERFRLQYLNGLIASSTQRQEEAIAAYKDALESTKDLSRNPPTSEFDHERSQAMLQLGNLYRTSRRLEEAESSLKESASILEQILAIEKGNIDAQYNLGGTYNYLGLTYANQGQNDKAMIAYEQSKGLFETLARDHPDLPNYRGSMASVLNNMALIHSKNGDAEKAAEQNSKIVQIFEQLKKDYPQRLDLAERYASSCANQGKYTLEQGRTNDSIVWNTKAIEAEEEVLRTEPRHTDARWTLHQCLMGRASAYLKLDLQEKAVSDYRRSLELSEGETHRDYVNFRPRALAHVGEHRHAADAVEAIINSDKVTTSNFREMAKVYAKCFEVAAGDVSLAEADRPVVSEAYAVRAIELLRIAAERGLFLQVEDVQELQTNDRLRPIQHRKDFQEFVDGLERTLQAKDTNDSLPVLK
jgi:eukaryotic-like serine/threonine-protein kinase